jgi:hypothetical protein
MTHPYSLALRGLKVEKENVYAWAENSDLVSPLALLKKGQ